MNKKDADMNRKDVDMAPDEKKMKKLAKLSSQLNHESDALNTVIKDLEERLGEMNLGVAVWLDTTFDDDPYEKSEDAADQKLPDDKPLFWALQLGYGLIDGHWCIGVRTIVYRETPIGRPDILDVRGYSPLLTASRLTRLQAAPYLNDLIEAITGQVQEYINDVQSARKAAEGGGEE